MIDIIKIEIYKIIKSKLYLSLTIVLAIFMVLSYCLSYYEPGDNGSFLRYYYYIFMINNQFLFPVAVTVFFSPLLIMEYKNQTFKLLLSTKYSRTWHYIAKYIAGSLCFFIIFGVLTLVYMVIVEIFVADISNMQISIGDVVFRVIVVFLAFFSYLICFGSFVMFLSILTKNIGLNFLASVGLLLLFLFIPVPDSIREYIFLKSSAVYSSLGLSDFPIFEIIKYTLVNITTLTLFCGIGTYIFERQRLM